MLVIPLSEASRVGQVGGKAAGLGELIRRGERVPPGFVVTTAAFRDRVIPEEEIRSAYAGMAAGPVAVRSSATAEDLPGASFAGQHDTVLCVEGGDELVAAVAKCWESLHSARATAYREARGIGHDGQMAVIVQRMVDAETAGVLFTANPVTGRRDEMVVDAARGLGPAVVDGAAGVDHYVLGEGDGGEAPAEGCLTPAQLAELRTVGERFTAPVDVEWAYDRDGTLWLLQARPITTLFPLPPQTGDLRIYLEFGHVQGMLRPVTPMGSATLRRTIAQLAASLGLRVEVVDIGGRLYGDLTGPVRSPSARKRLVRLMAVDFGPRAQAVMEHVLADPRFAPVRESKPAASGRDDGRTRPGAGTAVRAVIGIVRALARPDAARARLFRAVEDLRLASAAPDDLQTAADRLRFVRARDDDPGAADALTWPIVAGLLACAVPEQLLRGVVTTEEIHRVLAGVPHNVTLEMDLALWRLARDAAGHRELLTGTPPTDLAARYGRGDLPEIGLAGFLDRYGHRVAAEADVGVPRWSEDPAPVFAAIANFLRITDPEQAPDRRFGRAAEAGEAALAEVTARARRSRPVRGRLAVLLLRRARRLAGLREAGKFAGLYRLRTIREQLLLIGAELAGAGRLDEAADVMFLTLDDVTAAVHNGTDQRETVATRKAVHRAESLRRSVPVALLSDGSDVESLLPAASGAAGVLNGVGASAGRVTGPARVVLDPATARVEPGEILIAATTDPGWTPLFLTAAALVTETGAIMAHGPTVAREYGIPAVISVPGATERIATGRLITVDGASGTVSM